MLCLARKQKYVEKCAFELLARAIWNRLLRCSCYEIAFRSQPLSEADLSWQHKVSLSVAKEREPSPDTKSLQLAFCARRWKKYAQIPSGRIKVWDQVSRVLSAVQMAAGWELLPVVYYIDTWQYQKLAYLAVLGTFWSISRVRFSPAGESCWCLGAVKMQSILQMPSSCALSVLPVFVIENLVPWVLVEQNGCFKHLEFGHRPLKCQL